MVSLIKEISRERNFIRKRKKENPLTLKKRFLYIKKMLIRVSYRVTTRMLTRVVSKYLIFAVRYLVDRHVVAGLLPTP